MRNLKRIFLNGLGLLSLAILPAIGLSQPATEFFVSPKGSDSNPGSADRPFRTLQWAKRAVREARGAIQADIDVNIAAGDYVLDEPLEFSEADSAGQGYRIVWRSADGIGRARVWGSVPAEKWTRHEGNIWKTQVGDREFHTLYDNGRRARKARHPNYEHPPEFPTADAKYLTSKDGSPNYEKGKNPGTSWIIWREGDVDPTGISTGTLTIKIFPWDKRNWHRWTCEVTRIEPENRKIVFDNRGDRTEILDRARYYLEDHYSFLDEPGEFHLDRETDTLYYIPMDGGDPNEGSVRIPRTLSLFRFVGDEPTAKVRGITLDGLTMMETDAISPTRFWWGQQWGLTDHGCVFMTNAKEIFVRNCHMKNSGRNGVMMAGPNHDNRVENCWIEQMGVNGVIISNMRGRVAEENPDVGFSLRNIVDNCRIHDIGQLSIYNSGVGIFRASHNEVTHCEIYNSPRYATTIRGNTVGQGDVGYHHKAPPSTGNRFAYLRIFECGHDSGDMGAVHAASLNIDGGPYINTWEQIVITDCHAVPGMHDWPPDGIFLDWPDLTTNQVFRNVFVRDTGGQQLRSNGPANEETAVKDNVSWEEGFDALKMDFNAIGVRPDFPAEFGGRGDLYDPPAQPEIDTVEAKTYHSVRVEWTLPPSGREQEIVSIVVRDGKGQATLGGNEYLDTGLQELTGYIYQVYPLAERGIIGEPSEKVQVQTPADMISPTVETAVTGGDRRHVALAFSEPVDGESVQTTANYSIGSGQNIVDVQWDSRNPATAVVELDSPLPPGRVPLLTVNGVTDQARMANPSHSSTPIESFPSDSMMLHYRFDESEGMTVADSSGNGYDGTIPGKPEWKPLEGRVKGALQFKRNSETFIEVPPEVVLGNRDFTFAAWIYKDSPGNRVVASQGVGFNEPGQWSIGWEMPPGSKNISFRSNNTYTTTTAESVMPKEWVHIVFTRQGDTGRWYINGKPDGPEHDMSHLGALTAEKILRVGRRDYEESPAWFLGKMDELRIYTRALAPGEVKLLHATQFDLF